MKRFILALVTAWVLIVAPAYAVEVQLQWPSGTQFFQDDGSINDSGTINIYDSGTTSARTTYSDSDGEVANTVNGSNQIVLDGTGRISESVFIPTGAWKFLIKDSGGNTEQTADGLLGALDTSVFATGTVAWTLPVLSKTANYPVVADDLGKCINANPTGGAFTITLLSAATAGDGKTICVRHVGTANEVTIATVSGQTIDDKDTFPLTTEYGSLLIVSDGANWHVLAEANPLGAHIFIVKERLTAPPASPTAGSLYIINGTPTGDWSAFSLHDVVRASGNGSWQQFVPPTDSGWLAFVQDDNVTTQFRDTAWVDLSNITAPATSSQGVFTAQHTEATNTVGGTATASAFTARKLDTTETNTITDASLSSNQITLPTGSYHVTWCQTFGQTADYTGRFVSTTDSTNVVEGTVRSGGGAEGATVCGSGLVSITAATELFELRYFASTSLSTSDLGRPINAGSRLEVYAFVNVLDAVSIQGPTGPTGAQGATGATGYPGHAFDFDTDTDDSVDGDDGDLRLSSGTLSAVTTIMVDDLDRNAVGISTDVLTWDDQTSAIRGTVTLRSEGTASDIAVYDITGASTDNSGWINLSVTAVTSNGTFSEGEDVVLSFARTGDKGDTGSTGATGVAGPTLAVGWTYSSATTDSDPGSGVFRLDNATPASAAQAFIDENEIGGSDVTAWLTSWDDNGTSAKRGTLTLTDASDSSVFYIYTVTGSVVDGTGYRKVSLTYVSGSGTLAGEVHMLFANRGDTGSGDVTGPVSSVDNELVQFDGATGKVLESVTATGIIVTNSGVITAGRTVTASASAAEEGITISNGSGVSGDPTIGLDITGLSADTDLAPTDTIPHYDGTNNKKVTVDNLFKRTETFIIPSHALISAITNGAEITTRSMGSLTVPIAAFDASTGETAVFTFSMPDSWDLSTIQVTELHWTAASGSGTVRWDVACGAVADSGAISTSILGTAGNYTDTLITADDNHVITSVTNITVANAATNTMILCEVSYNVAEASLAVDAELISITFEYTVNARSD